MQDRTVGVAVLGAGNIGGAVAQAIASDANALCACSGIQLRLIGVLNRSGKPSATTEGIDPALITNDADALLNDPAVDIVVETMGGEQPAAELMAKALKSGKHVVTANKEAVAKQFPTLMQAAAAGEAGFLCEASVGGGIPLLVSLRQVLATNQVDRIRGIVNGTTNFILTKMDAAGAGYAETLKEAQELGYAEPDPTADVEGFDSSYKLAILASMMTGQWISPEQVDRTGISAVTAEDIADAKSRGGTLRLIADAQRTTDGVSLRVAPTFVANDDMFSRVTRNFNAIEVTGDRVGSVLLYGQGAGPSPTASAILSDIMEIARNGSKARVSVADQ